MVLFTILIVGKLAYYLYVPNLKSSQGQDFFSLFLPAPSRNSLHREEDLRRAIRKKEQDSVEEQDGLHLQNLHASGESVGKKKSKGGEGLICMWWWWWWY